MVQSKKNSAVNRRTKTLNNQGKKCNQLKRKKQPRSLPIAKKGIHSGSDFARFMSALMSDLIEETIEPKTANAAINAGGKLLKVVELQLKYGTAISTKSKTKQLSLTT